MHSLSTKLFALTLFVALASGCASVTDDAGLQPEQPAVELTRSGYPGDEDGGKYCDKDFPRPNFMTGGGRIDCSVGEPQPCPPVKSTPQSRDFQTFGFNFGDKDGDGAVEGQLQHVDHRDAFRINGSPRNYHSVSWTPYEPIDPAPFCDGGGDGAAEAGGTIERKNDGTTWGFRVRVVDCGEPGTKAPHDQYGIEVADGYMVYGELTGGNIQAHFRGGESGGSARGEASGARANTATTQTSPEPHAQHGPNNYDEDSAASVNAADLVRAENAFAIAAGGADSHESVSQDVSTLENVNVLNGLITADGVTAIAASAVHDGVAVSNAAGSQFSNLVVNGVAIDGNVAPNTRIDIPGVGTVTLNRQIPSGDGVGSTGMTVNMIHVVLKDALTGAQTGEIVVGSASSAATSN